MALSSSAQSVAFCANGPPWSSDEANAIMP